MDYCFTFVLSSVYLCPSVCWFWLHKCCLLTFPMLIGLKLSLYFVNILYFAVFWHSVSSHHCNQAHSTTCQALFICKFQIPSMFPYSYLQSMNMLSQWSFLYSTILCEMWLCKESHDGQLFHQYQPKKSPLTSKSLYTIMTRTYNIGNPGTGLGQTHHSCVDISGTVAHHCLHFFFIISTISVI